MREPCVRFLIMWLLKCVEAQLSLFLFRMSSVHHPHPNRLSTAFLRFYAKALEWHNACSKLSTYI
jgi:hypothetical protein